MRAPRKILSFVVLGSAGKTLFGPVIQTRNSESEELESSHSATLVIVGSVGRESHLGPENVVMVIADAQVLGAPVAMRPHARIEGVETRKEVGARLQPLADVADRLPLFPDIKTGIQVASGDIEVSVLCVLPPASESIRIMPA